MNDKGFALKQGIRVGLAAGIIASMTANNWWQAIIYAVGWLLALGLLIATVRED